MKLTFGRKISFNLTLFRIILAFIVLLVLFKNKEIALYLFLFAAFLSFFERFLSKKKKSELRIVFDFLADKLLINFIAIAFVLQGIFDWWIAAAFLGRDIVTIIGASILWTRDSHHVFRATMLGRLMLFFQIVALIPGFLGKVDWILVWIALAMTLVSLIQLFFKSEFALRKRSDMGELFQIRHLIKVADIFTLFNVLLGMGAIIFALQGRYLYSMACLLAAVVFDFFDGKLARILGQQNNFGKELDSLADTVSFGVAPAIIGFTLIDTTIAIFSFTIFLFCGILRLARFNVMQMNDRFEGMPITLNGLIIPLIYFVGMPVMFYPYVYIVLGILMISSFGFKKL